MELTAREIAGLVGGTLTGQADVAVTGVAGIKEARAGDVTFVASPKYSAALKVTQASVILLTPAMAVSFAGQSKATLVIVENPQVAFTELVRKISPAPIRYAPGIHSTAVIAPTATLGREVSIQPHVVIEPGAVIGDRAVIGAGSYVGHDCRVGHDSLVYPRVVLREQTIVGDRVILHSGVVLGADGFGFDSVEGLHQKIPQLGNVEIGDDVEIGANTTIDRARFGTTRVGRGTKIDNLVQIGHNCVIGEHCIICGLVGMAGSTIIGNDITIAGQAGLAGHLSIGDKTIIMAQAGVTKDVPAGSLMLGAPAIPHREFKRINAATQNLPELAAKLRELQQQIDELRSRGKS